MAGQKSNLALNTAWPSILLHSRAETFSVNSFIHTSAVCHSSRTDSSYYYNTPNLANFDYIVMQRSVDNKSTWSTIARGSNGW